jgi:hypothetical protein
LLQNVGLRQAGGESVGGFPWVQACGGHQLGEMEHLWGHNFATESAPSRFETSGKKIAKSNYYGAQSFRNPQRGGAQPNGRFRILLEVAVSIVRNKAMIASPSAIVRRQCEEACYHRNDDRGEQHKRRYRNYHLLCQVSPHLSPNPPSGIVSPPNR